MKVSPLLSVVALITSPGAGLFAIKAYNKASEAEINDLEEFLSCTPADNGVGCPHNEELVRMLGGGAQPAKGQRGMAVSWHPCASEGTFREPGGWRYN